MNISIMATKPDLGANPFFLYDRETDIMIRMSNKLLNNNENAFLVIEISKGFT
jgi:hypothetical protein